MNVILDIEEHHREKLLELANRLAVKIPPQYKNVDLSNCLDVYEQTDNPEFKKNAMDLILENFETVSVGYIKKI